MRGEKQKLSLPRPSFSKRDVDLVFLRSSLTFAKRSPSGNGAWMQIKLFFSPRCQTCFLNDASESGRSLSSVRQMNELFPAARVQGENGDV